MFSHANEFNDMVAEHDRQEQEQERKAQSERQRKNKRRKHSLENEEPTLPGSAPGRGLRKKPSNDRYAGAVYSMHGTGADRPTDAAEHAP